jgi:hypothetical protein
VAAHGTTKFGGSWLNLVERWFALLTEKQLRRGAHRNTRPHDDNVDAFSQALAYLRGQG